MSRMGNEMLVELSALLGKYDMTKEAAKKGDKEEDKEKEKAKKEKEKEKAKKEKEKEKEKAEKEKEKAKKEKKDSKKKKKAEVMVDVLEGLSKLATELDSIGAEEASSLVDDALRIIVKNMEQADVAKKVNARRRGLEGDEELGRGIGGPGRGRGLGRGLQDGSANNPLCSVDSEYETPEEDITEWMEEEGSASGGEEGAGSRQGPPMQSFKGLEPEGLAPGDVGGGEEGAAITEDKLDKLLRDPATRARIQEKLRGL